MSSQLAILGGKPITKMPERKSTIGPEEYKAAAKVLSEGVLSGFRGGKYVRKFEVAFAKYIGTKYSVATSSGTAALHASIAALGLKAGDEVLVPAMTFVSTASVALQENLSVVFVDIDKYFCMDIEDLKSKITSRSKVIIPVHLYGQVSKMDNIMKIAKDYGLLVIEDACQSHGATFGNKMTGNLGDLGCFSFFETKNMTCGEGGMITTSNPKLYEQVCLRREHGSPRNLNTWYSYNSLGFNYNMTELQGAIGLAQLKKLNLMNKARAKNAKLYDKYLEDSDLVLPKHQQGIKSVHHNYPVLLPAKYRTKRTFFVDAIRAEGIPIDIAYPTTLYQTKLFRKLGFENKCPHAEDYSSRLFTLFTDSTINEKIIANTAKAIRKVLRYLDEF